MQRFLGVEGELPPHLAEAFGELLLGFRRVARELYRSVSSAVPNDEAE